MVARLAHAAWLAASARAHDGFARALHAPRAAQESLLRRYLRDGRATRFGCEHAFDSIGSHAEYAARVPRRDYEALRPWIVATGRGERDVLTRQPVRRMQPTGGSTGGCKWIPFTAALQAEFARAVGAWITDLSRQFPQVARGRAYWSVTPAAEVPVDPEMTIRTGFEDDSDYLGGLLAPLVDATFAVPGDVRRVRDLAEFRRLTLLHLLRAEDLAMISVWHPSFLDLLMDAMRADWDRLLVDLECGVPRGPGAIRVPPSPRRAHALRAASPDHPATLWPRLSLISCWGDAAASGPMQHLESRFTGVAFQPKGLIATEAIVSVPFRGRHPLACTSHFFEFESDDGRAHAAWDLVEGETYSVLVTTGGGLYRYRLRDRVLVTGFLERTPCVRFLGKEDRISDRCGEKLDEAFVAGALERAFSAFGVSATFAMLAPETEERPVRYVLFLASRDAVPAGLPEVLEVELKRNPQYAYAVALGQLHPVSVEPVGPGAAECYLERLRSRGARLGEIKPCALSALDGWRGTFRAARPACPSTT